MKRFNSQSDNRKIKRGRLRFSLSQFIKNFDGSPKIIREIKTKRGKWVIAN